MTHCAPPNERLKLAVPAAHRMRFTFGCTVFRIPFVNLSVRRRSVVVRYWVWAALTLLLGCDATSPGSGRPLLWAQLDAGTTATCGVTLEGDGYCWGEAWTSGGSDTSRPILVPRRLAGHRQWLMIEVGRAFACGITVAHETMCWAPGGGHFDSLPKQVKGDQEFATITVGDNHACGLTAAGAAWCWGDNFRGELGLAYPDYLTAPHDSAVQPAGGKNYLALRAGPESTCGLVANGDLFCWGGSEVEGDGFTPHLVQSGFGFTALSFGGNIGGRGRACAIAVDSLYCFGYEAHSLLPQPTPTTVTLTGGGNPDQAAVGGTWQPFVGLPYAYVLHECEVTTAGSVFCWGSNDYGQLGDSSTVDQAIPTTVAGLPAVASVTAGGIHTCALTRDGTAYCWGWNGRGQLGIGSRQDHVTTPMRVVSAP
jgi:hypothetical protein